MPLVFGRSLLEHGKLDAHIGPLGDFHLNTALFFDMGVAQVVVGTVLLFLVAFGERLPLFGAPWMLRVAPEEDE